MRKILFCLQTMVRGGVEKELITVLKKMDPKHFQCEVLLLYIQNPEVVSEIPDWVKVTTLNIDSNYYCGSTASMVKARLKHGEIPEAITLMGKRVFGLGTSHSNQSLDGIPQMEENYDVAVCYHIHSPLMLKYVATKVNAAKKIGWIHNDFSQSGYPVQRLKKYLSVYHEFVAVSETVKNEFLDRCPEYCEITSVVHNALDEDDVREKALDIPENDVYFSDDRVKILTIGRFTPQKGFDLAIEICRLLREQNANFGWYMIGWGPEEDKYRAMIERYELQDCVTILGERKNPYPYIDQCDVYVQPSRHEAYCMTILEAISLRKPIVCANFAGADEQIRNGETGWIVPVGDIEAFTEKIRFLIENPAERTRLTQNLWKQAKGSDMEKILSKFGEIRQ